MKTFAKVCGAVLALGVLLAGIGYAFGGRQLSPGSVPGFHWVERQIDRWDGDWGYDFDFREHDTWDEGDFRASDTPNAFRAEEHADAAEVPPNAPRTALTPANYDKVRHVRLDLSEGRYALRDANEAEGCPPFSVAGSALRSCESGFDGGDTWRVTARGKASASEDEITQIYLPAGFYAADFELNIGAGTCTADAIMAENFELNVGAGAAQILSLDCPDIEVNVGAGLAQLTLPQQWNDCGYDAQAGLGAISVNDSALLSGIGEAKRDGSPMLELSVGAGKIEVHTLY